MSQTSKSRIMLGGVILVAAILTYVGYWTYDHKHLSSELKRTLTAAVDPNSSDSDTLIYLRDARLQIHTKRDAEVEAKLQAAIQDAQISTEAQRRIHQRLIERISSLGEQTPAAKFLEIEQQYRDSHLAIPASLKADVEQALKDQKESSEVENHDDDEDAKTADRERLEAVRLFQEVRSDLGLAPLPKQ